MDVRLVTAMLLAAAALGLTGAVHEAAILDSGCFELLPDGPIWGAWSVLTMFGPSGGSPALRWSEPPRGTGGLLLVAEQFDPAGKSRGVLWAAAGRTHGRGRLPAGLPREPSPLPGWCQGASADGRPGFSPPEWSQALDSRIRFRLFALRDPGALCRAGDPGQWLDRARREALDVAVWEVRGPLRHESDVVSFALSAPPESRRLKPEKSPSSLPFQASQAIAMEPLSSTKP
jgi:hypothetical protein